MFEHGMWGRTYGRTDVEVCQNITQDLCNGNAHSARKRKLAILINKRHVQILIAGAFPAGT